MDDRNKSSNVPTRRRASKFCHADGSSERTFAWLGRCRRLAKDFEATIASAVAWVFVAHIRTPSHAANSGKSLKSNEIIMSWDTKESRAALRGVSDPEQLDQVLKQYPKNEILRMVLLANRDAIEIDTATRRIINEVEPRDFSTPIDFRTANRSDLDALRRDLKTAEINVAALRPRYIALIKAQRDKLENDARSLKVGKPMLAKFMTMVDEQHKQIMTLTSKMLAARAEYYGLRTMCRAFG